MTEIAYLPPVIRNFGKKYGEIFKIPSESETGLSGRFVLSGLENSIRIWALGGSITHDRVCRDLNVEGRILGGGSLFVNKDVTSLKVIGQSGTFGSLPNSLLINYFKHFGYKIEADMVMGDRFKLQWSQESESFITVGL